MSRIYITSLNKQLKHVTHQPVPKPAQEQDEYQVQPMGNEHVNAPNINATQRGEAINQHQNATESVV